MKKKAIISLLAVLLAILAAVPVFWNQFRSVLCPNRVTVGNSSVIQLDDENIFVIDEGSKRVIKADFNGNYLALVNSGAGTFDSAMDVESGAQGEFYVRDIVWNTNGMDIDREQIVKFDAWGNQKGVVLVRDYAAAGQIVSAPKIFGPYWDGERLLVIEVFDDGFEIIQAGQERAAEVYGYENAAKTVAFCAVRGGVTYIVDKKGIVFTVQNGAVSEFYRPEREQIPHAAMPVSAEAGAGGVYIADGGKRNIILADGQGGARVVFSGEETAGPGTEFGLLPIYKTVSANQNAVATIEFDSIFVKDLTGQELLNTSELTYGHGLLVTKYVFMFLAAVGACILLFFVFLGAVKALKGLKMSLGTKIGAVIMAAMLITIGIILPITYVNGQTMHINGTLAQLSSIVQAGGYQIDTNALDRVTSPEDYLNPDYARLQGSMETIIDRSHEWNDKLYCMLYQYKEGILYTPIFLDGTGGAFYPYDYSLEDLGLDAVLYDGEIVQTELYEDSSGAWMYVQGPVYDDDGNIVAVIEAGLDLNSFRAYYNRFYSSIVLMVLSAGIVLQMIITQILKLINYFEKKKKLKAEGRVELQPIEFIGPLVFLVFFAFNLSTSFIPLHAVKIAQQVTWLPTELAQVLPISSNLLAVVLGCAVSGGIIHRLGIKRTAFLGAVLALAAYCALPVLAGYVPFTLVFVLSGVGIGVLQNSINAYIAGYKDAAERSIGFSDFNSALFSGFNCGTVVGAFMAERMGYGTVFIATGVVLLLAGVFVLRFMTVGHGLGTAEKPSGRLASLRTLFNPRVLVLFVCALIPYTVSAHFLFYFMPIYGQGLGFTESVIGQLFLVNGICVLIFSSLLTRLTSKYLSDALAILLSLAVIAAAFVMFALSPTTATLIAVLIMLGIASSFGAAAIRSRYSKLKAVEKLSSGKAMGLFSTVENAGDALGPAVFNFVLAGAITQNFVILAAGIAVLGVLALALLSGRKN